jgi:phosphoglycolate phosphatase-like HAD superfamily hydrolase
MKLVLFDIDGTLLLTSGRGSRSLEKIFRGLFGIEDAMRGVPVAGRIDTAILDDLFRRRLGRPPHDHEIDEVKSAYAADLEAALAEPNSVELLPGVPVVLDELSRRTDVLLGVATGNLEKTGRIKLRHGGIEAFFRYGGFAEDAGPRGERSEVLRSAARRGQDILGHPVDESRILVIGDTPLDVSAARAAGYRVLAVATGFTGRDVLESTGPDHALEDLSNPAALHAILDALGAIEDDGGPTDDLGAPIT